MVETLTCGREEGVVLPGPVGTRAAQDPVVSGQETQPVAHSAEVARLYCLRTCKKNWIVEVVGMDPSVDVGAERSGLCVHDARGQGWGGDLVGQG